MTKQGGPDDRVEKLMSITRAEFETGLARLTGVPLSIDGGGDYLLPVAGGTRETVGCSFEPLPEVVLGGLMKLPRARVRLDLAALPGDARAAFVARFDRTFQRGGG